MSETLLLRLAGPLQAWGSSSRFSRRSTEHQPTKSGVVGLIAAAQGRRRTDPVEDLAAMRFGVRIDQPGRLVRDFQTAIRLTDGKPMPLSYRFYLADAVFVAAVEGDGELLRGLDEAIRSPTFPLFLGRRSCPPAGAVALGIRDRSLVAALQEEPWHASRWYRRKSAHRIDLEIRRDADPGADPPETGAVMRDVPASFDPVRREYGWRTVVQDRPAEVVNDLARGDEDPDFMAVVGGS